MTRSFTKQAAAIFATCGLAATCALAQPTPDAVVTISGAGSQVAPAIAVGAGQVKWIRIDLGVAANTASTNFLDIIGGNSAGVDFDAEFFLFDGVGTFIATDDQDGPGGHSLLSFGGGCGAVARTGGGLGAPPLSASASRNGGDGQLAAGTYWLAITGFNGSQNTLPWGVTTTSTLTGTVEATFNVAAVGGAPVTPSTNLVNVGTLTNPQTFTDSQSFAGSTVRWYQFTIPAVGPGNSFLDIFTSQGATGGTRDTELTLYRADGTLAGTDDDDGTGSYSALSFGLATPTRPLTGGVAFNGRDGATLAAGTYYLATSYFSTTNGANCFGAVSTSTALVADTVTNIVLGNFASLPPSGVASASPTSVANCGSGASSTTLLTVTVTPGTSPASTGLTVVGDLSAIGGSATQAFNDAGTGGDVAANDNIFSFTAVVPSSVTTGAKTLNYTIADSVPRTATAAGSVTVTLCPPTAPACPSGTSILSATNLDSGGALTGSLNPNGTATATISGAGLVNTIRLSGLVQELNTATWATELKVRVQTPSGATYTINPVPATASGATAAERGFDLGALNSGFREFTNLELVIPAESANGVWTITTYEGPETPPGTGTNFDDTGVDARWLGLCLTAVNTQTPPIISASGWSVATVSDVAGGPFPATSSLLTATVAPGGNPTSTGLAVTVDLSALGGSATQALLDNGLNGDVAANDGIYSYNFTAVASTPVGAFATPISVIDAQGRTATATRNLSVGRVVSLGSISAATDGLLADDVSVGVGQVRWFSFTTCNGVEDTANEWFDITTNGVNTPNLADTMIGLYNSAGALVDFDDDYGVLAKSALTFGAGSGLTIGDTGALSDGANGATLPAGTYYLALTDYFATFNASGFSVVPTGLDAGLADLNFDTNLTCIPQCGTVDFNNDGLFPDDSDLIDLLTVLAGGVCSNDPNCNTIDFNGDGLFPDDNDLIDFLTVLAGGTPSSCIPR